MWSTSNQSVDAVRFGRHDELVTTGPLESYQPAWHSNNLFASTGCQLQQWPQQSEQTLQLSSQYQQYPNYSNYQQTFINSVSTGPNHSSNLSELSNQFQISQVQEQRKTVNFNPAPHNTRIPRSHQARITLVPNTKGGFRAIVKRKRKRTQFTSEQVEALESFFRIKPYITREERQILVDQLQVADSAVKVWFQNRRLRGKKEDQEYYSDSPTNEEFYSTNCRLDYIEAELNQKADQFGFITLDETAIDEIVSVVDEVLSADIELDKLSTHIVPSVPKTSQIMATLDLDESGKDSSIEESSKNTECSEDVEDITSSEDSAYYARSIYEPISPAMSVSENDQPVVWSPLAPKQSLQRLFDLHFC